MVLFLTSQENTNLLDFLINQEGKALPIKKMTGNFMLKQFVVYDMRNFSHCTELVLDRVAFGDEDEAFAEAIKEFLTMYNARITVIDEGLTEQDVLFQKLLEAGVGNIVTETEITNLQKEIRQSLSENGMIKYQTKVRNREKFEEEHYRFNADRIRIAVVGSQSRIGTTTLALGFVAWLGSVGAKACYVEKNENNIISCMADSYEMEIEENGCWLENMWFGKTIPKKENQFVVEDYGVCQELVEADVLLLVCGTKPYELAHTMKLLHRYETRTAFILCPFVDTELRDTYVEAIQSVYHNVLFVEYQPDCMNGNPNEKIYKTIVQKFIVKD